MDRNEKFLKSLSPEEFRTISEVLFLLYTNQVSTLDIKKLRGHKNIYRVRVGSIRIIYTRNAKQTIVEQISRRTDKTYRDY